MKGVIEKYFPDLKKGFDEITGRAREGSNKKNRENTQAHAGKF